MCDNSTREAKTIIDKIRKLLFNLDLTIVYANGEIKLRKSTMELYEGNTSKWAKKKFIEAKIEEERYQVYVEDVERNKQEIQENIEIILSKYNHRYKQIFVMYFFQDMTHQEIANETHYSIDSVNKIIRKLKNDLLTFYTL